MVGEPTGLLMAAAWLNSAVGEPTGSLMAAADADATLDRRAGPRPIHFTTVERSLILFVLLPIFAS